MPPGLLMSIDPLLLLLVFGLLMSIDPFLLLLSMLGPLAGPSQSSAGQPGSENCREGFPDHFGHLDISSYL